jgi:S1-C subfamily serine protease
MPRFLPYLLALWMVLVLAAPGHAAVLVARLGLDVEDMDPAAATALGLEEQGVLVAGVVPSFGADAAGIVVGDVILALDGAPMTNAADFDDSIARLDPGQKIQLTVLRRGERKQVAVRLTAPGAAKTFLDGLGLEMSPSESGAAGLRIEPVASGSAAAKAALAANDVIVSVNGRKTTTLAELHAALAGPLTDQQAALLTIKRQGRTLYRTLPPWQPEDE